MLLSEKTNWHFLECLSRLPKDTDGQIQMIKKLFALLLANHFRKNQGILLALCKVILWKVASRSFIRIQGEGDLILVGPERG